MERLKSLGPKNILLIAGGLIVVLLVVVGALFIKYNQLKKDPNADAAATSKRIVTEVSKIFAVPTNEEPTVALVQDKTKLKDQPFFNGTDNGDYVLVYQNKKIVLVYREKENKLINVGPINIGNQNSPSTNDTSKK
jgi:hypothetical protein